MQTITVLPESVANKIAAGEVIERPASVVKELVENSIDSGAKTITVEIEGGGLSLIAVYDDGCGMSRGDALLSIERHATSKIRSANDLGDIVTLGFRGEALPSIAAVSRFEMLTRDEGSLAGTRIKMAGGRLLDVLEEARPPGTTVWVRSLFYNTPVRKKFLRSARTERNHIIRAVVLLALSHGNITFRLVDGGKEVVYSPARESLRDRVVDLLGADFADHCLPVRHARDGVAVEGYAGNPGATRSTRRDQYVFVNGRPVASPEILRGIAGGYRTLLPGGRHAVALVFVEIGTAATDVNVHPAKREVRFSKPALVEGVVAEAISRTLRPGTPFVTREAGVPYEAPAAVTEGPPTKEELPSPPVPAVAGEQAEMPVERSMRVVGQMKGLYIVCEADEGLVIIDQHAAHERVLYERYVRDYRAGAVHVQSFLIPQVVELGPEESSIISRHVGSLAAIGYDIKPFGDRSFAVGAVPAHVSDADVTTLVRDMVAGMEEGSGGHAVSGTVEERLIAASCRSAVKRGDVLEHAHLQKLVDELLGCERPSSCPHGRPTMWARSWDELDSSFKR